MKLFVKLLCLVILALPLQGMSHSENVHNILKSIEVQTGGVGSGYREKARYFTNRLDKLITDEYIITVIKGFWNNAAARRSNTNICITVSDKNHGYVINVVKSVAEKLDLFWSLHYDSPNCNNDKYRIYSEDSE